MRTHARTFRLLTTAFLAPMLIRMGDARADEAASSAEVAAARELGVEGVKLANSGHCAEAIDKLSRAAKLFSAPTILDRLGECQLEVGKLVEGSETLQRALREPLPPNPPAAFVTARQRAQTMLNATRSKIARLNILVKAPPDAEYAIKIDGVSVSTAIVGADRPTDPGVHHVEASGQGLRPASTRLSLAEGGSASVTLILEPDPSAARPAVVDPGPANAPIREHGGDVATQNAPRPSVEYVSSGTSVQTTVGYVALGVGAAGAIVGTGFGLAAMSKKHDLDQGCADKFCPPSSQSDLDATKRYGTISTVGFAVAAVGAVSGVVLLLTAPSARTETSIANAPRIRPFFGPFGSGVTGTF